MHGTTRNINDDCCIQNMAKAPRSRGISRSVPAIHRVLLPHGPLRWMRVSSGVAWIVGARPRDGRRWVGGRGHRLEHQLPVPVLLLHEPIEEPMATHQVDAAEGHERREGDVEACWRV